MNPATQPSSSRALGSSGTRRNWLRIALASIGALLFMAILITLILLALYTSSAPLALPEVTVTPEDQDALTERWMQFRDVFAGDSPRTPFQFSSRDLQVFVSMMPRLRSRVDGRFDNNLLREQFSVPLWPGAHTRYINGTATVDLTLRHGDLQIEVKSCRLNGRPLPHWICRQLGRRSFNPEAYWITESFDFAAYIESIEIRGSSLVITPKPSE